MKKSESYVNQIVSEVKRMIINQELKIGDRLPTEAELSKKFNKSRGCVREAIKILEYYGILEVRQGDGTYVCASADSGMFDALFFQIIAEGSDFEELKNLRDILEIGIMQSAIEKVSAEDIEKLCEVENELLRAIDEKKDMEILVDMDLKFHHLIASFSKNNLLREVYRNLMEIFRPYILKSYERQDYEKEYSVSFHHELFIQALREKDQQLGYIAVKKAMNDWGRLNAVLGEKKGFL